MKVAFVVAVLLVVASPARAQQVLSDGSAITRRPHCARATALALDIGRRPDETAETRGVSRWRNDLGDLRSRIERISDYLSIVDRKIDPKSARSEIRDAS